MRAVPEFRGDEKLLAGNDGGDDFLESPSDLILVPVDHSKVKVTVAISDGDLDLAIHRRGE